ncbi:MAG: nucleoside phosphorylase [Anaerolineales bacterium]|nr:nucleoside phosphorylase [Anaerolineales bacterium]
MSFPNFPDKKQGEPVMKPKDTIEMRRTFGRFPAVDPPKGLILCLKNDLPYQLRWKTPVQKVGRVMGDVFLVKRTRGRVGVLSNFGIGAPVVVSLAEEMIAWGVERFVILSWGGALQKELHTGDVVLNDRAIRDEGVSHHYLPAEKYVSSDSSLKLKIESHLNSQNIKFTSGATWTTDAPYRETKEEILQYQSEGIQTVEMEIAGLFALARFRGVKAASIVIVADRLANLKWESPLGMKEINQSFEAAYNAAIDALNEDA